MSRPDASRRVAGAVTIATIATFLSDLTARLAIDTVWIAALGFGLGDGRPTASDSRSNRGVALARVRSAILTTSAGSRTQRR